MVRGVAMQKTSFHNAFFTEFGVHQPFRKKEKETLFYVSENHTSFHVLSLGGGTLLDRDSAELVKALYNIYTLAVPYPIMEQRILHSDRPLQDQAKDLYVQREEHYRGIGQRIQLGDASLEDALELLCEVLHAA